MVTHVELWAEGVFAGGDLEEGGPSLGPIAEFEHGLQGFGREATVETRRLGHMIHQLHRRHHNLLNGAWRLCIPFLHYTAATRTSLQI